MSNQKQVPPTVAQQQRFSDPNHMSNHARLGGETFPLGNQATAFVPQQGPGQTSAPQGPGMRGMAPAGPPTQASTPPQHADMKVQQMSQQPGGPISTMSYVQTQPVRGNQNSSYFRPPQQLQPRNRQPQLYQQQPQMFIQPTPMSPIQMQLSLQYGAQQTRPPAYFQQTYQTYVPASPAAIYGGFTNQQTQPPYYYAAQQNAAPINMAPRVGPPPSIPPVGPSGPSQQQTTVLASAPPPPVHTAVKKKRQHAIAIINPVTGKNMLDDIYDGDGSPPLPESGESSARDTPQPNDAVADFTKRVTRAAASDDLPQQVDMVPIPDEMVDTTKITKKFEPISVADSKLQAATKEFIPDMIKPHMTTKEMTPVVSANSDGHEVMISKGKERESPAKGRKHRGVEIARPEMNVPKQDVIVNVEGKQLPIVNTTLVNSMGVSPMMVNPMVNSSPVIVNVPPPTPIVVATATIPKQMQEVILPVMHQKDDRPVMPSAHIIHNVAQPVLPAQPQKEPAPSREHSVSKEQPIVSMPTQHETKNKMSGGNKSKMEQKSAQPVQNNVQPTVPIENTQGKQKSNAAAPKPGKEVNKPQQQQQQPPPQQQQQQQQQQIPVTNNNNSTSTMPATVTAAPPVVPVSQPVKPSNKAHKQRDLNRKGADKEGTDMDVFNDIAAPSAVAETAPVTAAPVPVVPKPVQTPAQANTSAQAPAAPQAQPVPNKTVDNKHVNDSPAPKLETKTLPKPKVDVCSIYRDTPKPVTVKPQVPKNNENEQDGSGVALTENDKLVQAKNEVNAKTGSNDVNATTDIVIDVKPRLPYAPGQWSPENPEGNKVYSREFLILLREDPKSKARPKDIPKEYLTTPADNNRPFLSQNRMQDNTRFLQMNRQHDVMLPGFAKLSQRGSLPLKRNSQQGKAKQGKPMIHMSLSLREDVKLHEAENAWRPACISKGGAANDEEAKTEKLYRKVRGVLNKLTPQKFNTLVSQVRTLHIDNCERLQGVIDLVFEKAVDEPNFSVAYALMCRELALIEVPVTSENIDNKINFRKLLIMRCQKEFEKENIDENARAGKIKDIENEGDPEKKKELQMALDEEDRKLRIKSVGNVRFIGELFKQQMLTVSIMVRCLQNLVDTIEEESLECLCKLLTTIGRDLEVDKKTDLSQFFTKMQEIVDRKHGRISSRVKFMLQDVIELRRSKWIPRRADVKPKTIDQIQKEAEHEQMNIQMMNSGPQSNTPRKDDNRQRLGAGGKRSSVTEDGWSTPASRTRQTYSVETQKLKSNKPASVDDIQLGSRMTFTSWGRGSTITKNNTTAQPALPSSTNKYAALEHINAEQDRTRPPALGSRNGSKEPYSSKGPSMERSFNKSSFEGRGSRGSSQAPSRDGSQARQTPPTPAPAPAPTPVAPARPAEPTPVLPQLSIKELKTRASNTLDEFLNDCSDVKECEAEIRQTFPASFMAEFVTECYNHVIDRSSTGRVATGKLMAHLISVNILSLVDYCTGLEVILSVADELCIDIPNLWLCLAEMIAPLLLESVLPLRMLHGICTDVIRLDFGDKLLQFLFNKISEEKGQAFVQQMWQESELSFTDFMSENKVAEFIKNTQMESATGKSTLNFEQVRSKLLAFFKAGTDLDNVIDWISTNIGDAKLEDKVIIRALITAVVEYSIESQGQGGWRLNRETLRKYYALLQRYIDNQESRELQCIYALQALINRLEHPPGLALSILDVLWDDSILSTESFLSWEKCVDPAEQEGKGVVLKTLTSLLTSLKEVADDDSSEGDAE